MGYDLHITRAEHWFESKETPITSDEWLQLVEDDPDLEIDSPENGNGPCFAYWTKHKTKHGDHPWFDWFNGEINTKWPDRETVGKMIEIAAKFDAVVQGDEDEIYVTAEDWPEDIE